MSRAPLEEGFPLGARLKSARQAQGLSQRELARRANITNANLSMIEQDKVSPALATLEKILLALSLDLNNFFSATGDFFPTYKSSEMLSIKRNGLVFQVLPQDDSAEAKLACVTIPETMNLEEFWLKGTGSVAGFVTHGELDLILHDTLYSLHKGDGFEFPLQSKFVLTNRSSEPALLFVAIVSKL